MRFIYQAKNKDGTLKKGFVMAASQEKAESLLSENGLLIISLNVQEDSILTKLNPFGKRVNYKDLVLFSRQLSTLISAQVPLLQSLRILESQISSKRLSSITRDLVASIEGGESFSLALSKHLDVFGNVYISLIRSGEASGSVSQALAYLADSLEKDFTLRANVKKAFTYPTFVLFALVSVGVLMFKFVLPKLTEVLKEQGGELPFISQVLIGATDFFEQFWWAVFLALGLLVLGFRYYISTPSGRHMFDLFKIKAPLFGDIFRKIYMARFARNLSTLVAGGIPIIQAIQIVGEIINNTVYRDILAEVSVKVSNGNSISDSLADYKEFPIIVTQMVKVGEQSAKLDEILMKMASYYEKEVDDKVAVLSTLLEPIIMIILGLAVGALVAGILLPIYNLASTVG
jgi:type IV pilus assembly protein PilC